MLWDVGVGLRVLVTGGCGFVGSHLVDALLGRGFQVRVVDDLSGGRLENVKQWEGDAGFELVVGGLRGVGAGFEGSCYRRLRFHRFASG